MAAPATLMWFQLCGKSNPQRRPRLQRSLPTKTTSDGRPQRAQPKPSRPPHLPRAAPRDGASRGGVTHAVPRAFPAMVTMIVATILMAIPATMLLAAVFALILAATKGPRDYFHFSYGCCRIITCDHDFTRPWLPLRGLIYRIATCRQDRRASVAGKG